MKFLFIPNVIRYNYSLGIIDNADTEGHSTLKQPSQF